MLVFRCECDQVLGVDESALGTTGECPSCGMVVIAPFNAVNAAGRLNKPAPKGEEVLAAAAKQIGKPQPAEVKSAPSSFAARSAATNIDSEENVPTMSAPPVIVQNESQSGAITKTAPKPHIPADEPVKAEEVAPPPKPVSVPPILLKKDGKDKSKQTTAIHPAAPKTPETKELNVPAAPPPSGAKSASAFSQPRESGKLAEGKKGRKSGVSMAPGKAAQQMGEEAPSESNGGSSKLWMLVAGVVVAAAVVAVVVFKFMNK